MRWFSDLTGIQTPLVLLDLVQPVAVHTEFLGRLDQKKASEPKVEQLRVLVLWSFTAPCSGIGACRTIEKMKGRASPDR